MSIEWYFREMDQELGPMAGSELRGYALEGRIMPDTPVRKGPHGAWMPARQVGGLLDQPSASPSHTSGGNAPSAAAAGGSTFAAASGEHVNPFAYPSGAGAPGKDNPFAAPRASLAPAQVAGPSELFWGYAGFWKRFAALIIDQFILFIGGALVGGVLGGIIGFAMAAQGAPMQAIESAAGAVGNIIGILIAWLYHALMESSSLQATVGKMALGIKVTDLEGRRIGFGRATGRHFAKIISGILLGIGFLMAAFTQRKQALHDSLANCLVVNSR